MQFILYFQLFVPTARLKSSLSICDRLPGLDIVCNIPSQPTACLSILRANVLNGDEVQITDDFKMNCAFGVLSKDSLTGA